MNRILIILFVIAFLYLTVFVAVDSGANYNAVTVRIFGFPTIQVNKAHKIHCKFWLDGRKVTGKNIYANAHREPTPYKTVSW